MARRPLSIGLAAFVLTATATANVPIAAQAGSLTRSTHPGCDYEFRGQVISGDAARLAQIDRNTYDGVTLCLDSPGGSVAEGQALFDLIRESNIGTRIPAGWRCESICAIIFMAGSIETGMGVSLTYSAHQLDPGGVLGFHAPGLNLPEGGSYTGRQVAEAFAVAVSAAGTFYRASLQEQDSWRSFNDYLFARMLETPTEEMYRIETVADAVLAGISLGPTRLPVRVGEAQIRHLCDAAVLSRAQPSIRVPQGDPLSAWSRLYYAHEPPEARAFRTAFHGVRISREGDWIIGRVGGYHVDRWSATGCEVRLLADHARAALSNPLDEQDSGGGAAVSLHRYYHTDDNGRPDLTWRGDADTLEDEFGVPLWYLHNPETQLAALAPDGTRTSTPASRVVGGMSHRVNTFEGGMVNLRSGPGTDHDIVLQLPHGIGLNVDASGPDGWVRIRTAHGTVGWINSRLLAAQ